MEQTAVEKFNLIDSEQMNIPEIWTQMFEYEQTGHRKIPMNVKQLKISNTLNWCLSQLLALCV